MAAGSTGGVAMARPLTIWTTYSALAFAEAASVTWTVIGKLPTWVGVPVRRPVAEKLPAGRVPVADQL